MNSRRCVEKVQSLKIKALIKFRGKSQKGRVWFQIERLMKSTKENFKPTDVSQTSEPGRIGGLPVITCPTYDCFMHYMHFISLSVDTVKCTEKSLSSCT